MYRQWKYATGLLLVTIGTSAAAADAFSALACGNAKIVGSPPEISGTTRFAPPQRPAPSGACETLLVFGNRHTALVRREIVADGEPQTQVLVVSDIHGTARPIIGRSQQHRTPVSSASFAEGGTRGGSRLPPIVEHVELLRVRSRGTALVGVETFQARFRLRRTMQREDAERHAERFEDRPLVEFDLCGRRVSLDAGIYPSVAEKVAACENYTERERAMFRQFWQF